MERELMFGSKPATTPNKRRLQPGGTPNGKTPNKLRRVSLTSLKISFVTATNAVFNRSRHYKFNTCTVKS